MSRYRSYGKAPGARTYLSSRDEFVMSESEKHEAYERRRKAAAEAEAAAASVSRVAETSLSKPMWPSPMSIMRFELQGTPIPPPPEGYTGHIPAKYAHHIAWPAAEETTAPAEEDDAHEEQVTAPGM